MRGTRLLARAICALAITSICVGPAMAKPKAPDSGTATPIQHVVVIFQENVSFDHYFATYPKAANPPGEPAFTAVPNTPKVNNLANAHLLTNNPNFTNKANGDDAKLGGSSEELRANC